jgi:hypothetical protein
VQNLLRGVKVVFAIAVAKKYWQKKIPDAGCKIPDARYQMQDAGCQIRDARWRMLDCVTLNPKR